MQYIRWRSISVLQDQYEYNYSNYHGHEGGVSMIGKTNAVGNSGGIQIVLRCNNLNLPSTFIESESNHSYIRYHSQGKSPKGLVSSDKSVYAIPYINSNKTVANMSTTSKSSTGDVVDGYTAYHWTIGGPCEGFSVISNIGGVSCVKVEYHIDGTSELQEGLLYIDGTTITSTDFPTIDVWTGIGGSNTSHEVVLCDFEIIS